MFSTEAKEKAIRIATKITDLLIGELVLEEDISPSQRFAEMIASAMKKSYTIDTVIFCLPDNKQVVTTTELNNIKRFKDGNKQIWGYRCVRKDDVWNIIKHAKSAVLVRSTLSGGKLTQSRLCFGQPILVVDEADADFKMKNIPKGIHFTYRGGSFGWLWMKQIINPIK